MDFLPEASFVLFFVNIKRMLFANNRGRVRRGFPKRVQ